MTNLKDGPEVRRPDYGAAAELHGHFEHWVFRLGRPGRHTVTRPDTQELLAVKLHSSPGV